MAKIWLNIENYLSVIPVIPSYLEHCCTNNYVFQVAQLSKFREGGGLGISLEGTVDVENGVEMRPHHYIRAILPDGPVGVNGRLLSSDELLEVGKFGFVLPAASKGKHR